MRRLRTFVLALLLAGLMVVSAFFSASCCHRKVSSSFSQPDVVEQISEHFISIKLDVDDELLTVASGVYVEVDEQPYILTAAHVWELLAVVSTEECVSFCYGDVCVCFDSSLPSAVNVEKDWALVPLLKPIGSSTPAPVNFDFVSLGADVYAAHCPNSLCVVTKGMVGGYANIFGNTFFHYLVDGYAFPGSSGGGIYNENAELIGILIAVDIFTGTYGPPSPNPDIYYALPTREINPLLSRTED